VPARAAGRRAAAKRRCNSQAHRHHSRSCLRCVCERRGQGFRSGGVSATHTALSLLSVAEAARLVVCQTMTCQVCFGRGHERCLVCDVEPRSGCRWCAGWGFRLCEQCGGSGVLKGLAAVDAAGTIAVDASGPFSLVRNYSRMRPLEGACASRSSPRLSTQQEGSRVLGSREGSRAQRSP